MAKIRGFGAMFSGSIGEITFAQTEGGTIAKQKVPSHNKSQSFRQMRQRLQLRNIQNMWHRFDGTLRPCFEGRRPGQRDYDAFVSANMVLVPVYLTKEEAQSRGCVVADYQISRGSLAEIQHGVDAGGMAVTDIALGDLAIGPETTVKEFADAVCANNSRHYQNMDRIVCFRCTQQVNAASGAPYADVVAEEVVLDRSDVATLLYDVCSEMCFSTVDGMLGGQMPVPGGMAWMHSRMENEKLRVSTQRLVVDNDLLPQYQSKEHLAESIRSYGGADIPKFLTPNNTDTVAPER